MNNQSDLKNQQTDRVLKEVEDNFITSARVHITYHEHLKLAQENNDMQQYMHHRVTMETYENVLNNYEASRRYGTV